jgi:tetratricopeptide (TPR) repeat protein
MKTILCIAAVALITPPPARQADLPAASDRVPDRSRAAALDDARRLFYNARYEAAAGLTHEACASAEDGLAACELQTAALLFQIRRAIGEPADKEKALKQCAVCPGLMTAFQSAVARGQALGRATLRLAPEDEATMFLLSKVDLNHVWLHLGTLGQKTGWREYWEARKTLDKLLKKNPDHVRARVARGWIDYIVDTKMPRGTRWLLGGGDKKGGLRAVREAANADAEFFVNVEARFALWDMQVRERNLDEAIDTARTLARDFPDNSELSRFLDANENVGASSGVRKND